MTNGHKKSGSTRPAERGAHRTLGVKTWLGAGALAVGVGAAIAGASGVAQADTGDHGTTSSSANKQHSATSAGPKRGPANAAAASVNQAGSRSVKLAAVSDDSVRPAAAASRPSPARASRLAAASVTAAQTEESTQTVETPFGPITVVTTVNSPDVGTSGPLSINVNASTPVGELAFSVAGAQTFTTTPLRNEVAFTGGTVVTSPQAALLGSAASAILAGGLSASGSADALITALQNNDVVGALLAFTTAAPQFISGFLFGDQTVTVPFELAETGTAVQLHIPAVGIFGAARSITLTVPAYSYIDEATGAEFKLDGTDFEFVGTKFGGAAWKLIGL